MLGVTDSLACTFICVANVNMFQMSCLQEISLLYSGLYNVILGLRRLCLHDLLSVGSAGQ